MSLRRAALTIKQVHCHANCTTYLEVVFGNDLQYTMWLTVSVRIRTMLI